MPKAEAAYTTLTLAGATRRCRALSKGLDLLVEDIRYHRNGVTGAGFHVVKFQTRRNGRIDTTYPPMVAVVFDDVHDRSGGAGHVAVLNQDLNARQKWAGHDVWGKDLLKVALRWEKAGRPTLVEGETVDHNLERSLAEGEVLPC